MGIDMNDEMINEFKKTRDEYLYDHIMILAPSINNFKSTDLSVESLLKFFDEGGNIYIALDQSSKKMGRSLIKEFGAELLPAKSIGMDS